MPYKHTLKSCASLRDCNENSKWKLMIPTCVISILTNTGFTSINN